MTATVIPLTPPPSTEIPPALAAMAALDQWICYRLAPKPNGKTDKIPSDPVTGYRINLMDPTLWMTASDASRLAQGAGMGVGFVLTEADDFFCIDIDNCATPGASTQWSTSAMDVLGLFPGAAVEVSCSGRGLHIFGCCAREFIHGCTNSLLGLELYTQKHFIAIGTGATGDAGLDCASQLLPWAAQVFPPSVADVGSADWTTEPLDGYTGPEDDDELIRRALAQRLTIEHHFGSKASFKDLWERNVDVLADAYPDSHVEKDFNYSDADLALAGHLAFWTGDNHERMRRLMNQSGLYRPKYDREGDDYLARTFRKACGGNIHDRQRGVDAPPPPGGQVAPVPSPGSVALVSPAVTGAILPPPPPPPLRGDIINTLSIPAALPVRTNAQIMYPGVQREYFAGCVFVESLDMVMRPDGTLVGSKCFKAIYGGYEFMRSNEAGATSTRNAYEAFTESQTNDFHTARSLRFMPLVYHTLVTVKGVNYANTWRRPIVPLTVGDATPFINHIRKLLPVGNDADQLIAYIAACVQHQGKKFTWCPLLQGIQGNGKTLIAECVKRAIGGEHVHEAKASQLVTEKFNGWLAGKTLIVVEDIRIQNERSAAMEILKPMITSTTLEIRRMRCEGVTEEICCNFLLTSNHKDAIPLTVGERRFAVLFCAQQSVEDLKAQGMGAAYFDKLFDWLRTEDGYAIISHFLWTYPIPSDLNPAGGCMRAPHTSSLREALTESLPLGAQHIAEAIALDEPGFRGGWLCSSAVTALLTEKRVKTSPKIQVGLIRMLGYVAHTAGSGKFSTTTDGRVRLYVRKGSEILKSVDTRAVADAYVLAQGVGPSS